MCCERKECFINYARKLDFCVELKVSKRYRVLGENLSTSLTFPCLVQSNHFISEIPRYALSFLIASFFVPIERHTTQCVLY